MKIKLGEKIMASAILITVLPLFFSYIIFLNDKLESDDRKLRENLYNVSYGISNTPFIAQKLSKGENDYTVHYYVNNFVKNMKNIDVIVVADISGIRYSHLNIKQVGGKFSGGDERQILKNKSGYFSVREGTLGKGLRRFDPIYYQDKLVGFVMVGKLYEAIEEGRADIKTRYWILFFVVLFCTIVFSWIFSRSIKNRILGLEPEEIAKLYMEKNIILENIKEGVIALDPQDEIVEMNKSALYILRDNDKEKVGKALVGFAKKRIPYYNREFILCNKRIFINLVPIIKEGQYLGSVITFVGQEEMKDIAREITGIDQVINSLRASVHEFKNKLHVVMGFIQMKEYDEAKNYIMKLQREENRNFSLVSAIEDHYINAILLAKGSMAKENRIDFQIENVSNLWGDHGIISSDDLVVIVGNLLDNAFEACMVFEDSENQVKLLLDEDDERIRIEVFDTGIEISNDMKRGIFERGVTTKGKNRGSGLSLVKDKIDLYNGFVDILEEKTGKRFIIELSKGVKYEKSFNS